jgi:broad specificity phosphatase PhoE
MTARIILVRHAEPARSARGRAIGRTDVGLSREGAKHARELAATLVADRIVSSPAKRAVNTAAPIARACSVTLEIDEALREIDFGALDGRMFASIERDHPDLYARWMRSPTTVAFPDGETWTQLRERSTAALDQLARAGNRRTTIAVTHLGVILATLGRVLPLPDDEVFGLTARHGQTFAFKVDQGSWLAESTVSRPSRVT